MKHFHRKMQQEAEKNVLTRKERAGIQARLSERIQERPVSTESLYLSQASIGIFSILLRPAYTLGALILVLGVMGGVSLAANQALPGDALYTIKTRVNEPVSGILAISDQAKVAWSAAVATERLKEAATLASEDRLSTTTGSELALAFTQSASQVNALTSSIAETDPVLATQLSSQFSDIVGTQSTAILNAGSTGTNTDNAEASTGFVRTIISQTVDTGGVVAINDTVPAQVSAEIAATTSVQTPAVVAPVQTAMLMTASVAPVSSAGGEMGRVQGKMVVSAYDTPNTLFARSLATATQLFTQNQASFSASSTAYITHELGDLKLISIQVSADRDAHAGDAAIQDLANGLVRSERLVVFIRAQLPNKVPIPITQESDIDTDSRSSSSMPTNTATPVANGAPVQTN